MTFEFLNLDDATDAEIGALHLLAALCDVSTDKTGAAKALEMLCHFPESWQLTIRQWCNGEFCK